MTIELKNGILIELSINGYEVNAWVTTDEKDEIAAWVNSGRKLLEETNDSLEKVFFGTSKKALRKTRTAMKKILIAKYNK